MCDATRSYARRTTIHKASADSTAVLASRLNQITTPTLLSPSQTRLYTDHEGNSELSRSTPEFQSNKFLKSPSRYFLAGLGVHYDLDSSDTPQIRDKSHSSCVCDGGNSISYIQDINDASRHSTPSCTLFQLGEHAGSFTCTGDSQSSLGFTNGASLPDLAFPSSLSSASLVSTWSVSGNEGIHVPTAFSVPFHLEDDVVPCPSADIGLIPDVNMYNLTLLTEQPCLGVDPLDTVGRVSRSPRTGWSPSGALLPFSYKAASRGYPPMYDAGPDPASQGAVRELTPPPLSQDYPPLDIIHNIATILSTSATEELYQMFMTDFHGAQPSLEQFAPQESARASPIIKMEQPNEPALFVSSPKRKEFYVPPKYDTFSSPSDGVFSPIHVRIERTRDDDPHPSPILNAHVGIELAELIFRAQRYRARHPGQPIDRAWLMQFAGKLTDRGELVDDYRCYVVGCDQKNKRRDHIVIHVGAHVDQREFSCSMWFVLL